MGRGSREVVLGANVLSVKDLNTSCALMNGKWLKRVANGPWFLVLSPRIFVLTF